MAEYIDREAVYKRACRGCTRHGDEIGSCYEEEPCEELQSEFASAPVADVEPVRHGRWIWGDTMGHSWMKCSECLVSQSGQTLCFTYCPNCGANMDEGAGEKHEP